MKWRCGRAAASQMKPAVEQDGGVFAVAEALRLGAGEAGQRDLARRRLPHLGVRFAPAEKAPALLGIERRALIVAAERMGRQHRGQAKRLPLFYPV